MSELKYFHGLRHVTPEDPGGSGLACLAMLLHVTYQESKRWFLDYHSPDSYNLTEWNSVSLRIYPMFDDVLARYGLATCRISRQYFWHVLNGTTRFVGGYRKDGDGLDKFRYYIILPDDFVLDPHMDTLRHESEYVHKVVAAVQGLCPDEAAHTTHESVYVTPSVPMDCVSLNWCVAWCYKGDEERYVHYGNPRNYPDAVAAAKGYNAANLATAWVVPISERDHAAIQQ